MKILLDNRTELKNEEIGIIIDDLQEREKGTTQYYGKWKGYELEFKNGKIIKIETMIMKKYLKSIMINIKKYVKIILPTKKK